MTDGAARGASESSGGCVSGTAQKGSRDMRGGLRWEYLLQPENGGPGESPGRAEAIVRAQARSAEKALPKPKPKKGKKR